MSPVSRAIAGLACAIALPAAAHAAEGGQSSYLKGYRDVYAGIIPPYTGWYVRDDVIYYKGDVGQTVLSGRAQVGLDLTSAVNVTTMTLVTDRKILGGQYAFGVLVPIAHAKISVQATGPLGNSISVEDDDTALTDLGVSPLTLGWHNGNVHTNFGVSVLLPSGPYETGRLANLSKNYPAVFTALAVSWMEPKSKWDASAALTYVVAFENQTTDYDTGDIVHLDAAVTKGFGEWRLGVVAYGMVQVTDDSGSGAVLGSQRSQVWGVGPIVTYDAKFGERPVTLYAKWYHEFDAHKTTEGDTVAAAFSLKF
jgi:hypothetical protein